MNPPVALEPPCDGDAAVGQEDWLPGRYLKPDLLIIDDRGMHQPDRDPRQKSASSTMR